MVEPMAIGAHGIRRADVQPGEFVLVIGAGPIGLATMEFAKLKGAQVIALDLNPHRLEFCKNILGISNIINGGDPDVIGQLSDITQGNMPTVVLDASGNRKAIHSGLSYLAHGGRFILIGIQKEEIIFSHPEFHKKEATLMSSRNATRDDFEYVIQNIVNRKVSPRFFITNRVKFSDAAAGFPEWSHPSNRVIKVIIEKD
jgi:threonine dehydrogenase-like Zn-dependent dehydrogenase